MDESVVWDGKNLAAVQSLLPHGSYTISEDWTVLLVEGKLVEIGQRVTMHANGRITVEGSENDV